jgi:hypothetical protein
LPTSLSDLVLLRRAINQDWPVSAPVRQAIVAELGEGLESNDARRTISIAKTFIAMDWANLRLEGVKRRTRGRGRRGASVRRGN